MVAAGTFGLVSLAGGAVQFVGEYWPGAESIILDTVKNPLVWLGAFAVYGGIGKFWEKRSTDGRAQVSIEGEQQRNKND